MQVFNYKLIYNKKNENSVFEKIHKVFFKNKFLFNALLKAMFFDTGQERFPIKQIK